MYMYIHLVESLCTTCKLRVVHHAKGNLGNNLLAMYIYIPLLDYFQIQQFHQLLFHIHCHQLYTAEIETHYHHNMYTSA